MTTSEVSRLNPVDLRKVWPHEALDLTPWLAENTDLLGEALGMDLELEGAEVPVGPFSADLLLRDLSTGRLVVVENLISPTDHDHVGKLITYAAGLSAAYAVLLAEHFRPEHASALHWLNSITTEDTGFFGIELHVWQIDHSLPAPHLEIVVEPDEWARQVKAATGGLTPTEAAYVSFWSQLLPRFHQTYPTWSNKRTPPKDSWMNIPAGSSSYTYALGFCRPDTVHKFRVELYIDSGDKDENRRRFDLLHSDKESIEDRFGEPLSWEPLADKQACRIAAYHAEPIRVTDTERLPELSDWAIDTVGRFRDALQPSLNQT